MEVKGWKKIALEGPCSPTGSQKETRCLVSSASHDRRPIYSRVMCAPRLGGQVDVPAPTTQPHPAPTSRT